MISLITQAQQLNNKIMDNKETEQRNGFDSRNPCSVAESIQPKGLRGTKGFHWW
mgnify:FL=1|jgi:hypothetical protein